MATLLLRVQPEWQMDEHSRPDSWSRIAPRRPTEWLVLLLLGGVLVGIGFGGYTAYQRYAQQRRQALERRHSEAMARWLELARTGFRGASREEIRRTFGECFRKGDPASDYAAHFASAAYREVYPTDPSRIDYHWYPEPSGEKDARYYRVVVMGTPPVVEYGYVERVGCDDP